jgi:hypothetical protein
MQWAFMFFEGAGAKFRKDGPDVFLFELLRRMRVDPEILARKENLLASEFEFQGSGHLPGYLMVKVLWRSAVARTTRALDRDHFLAFVKSYFYDDYAFVATLLDPATCEHNSANAIGLYFQDRIRQFLTIDLDTAMAEHEGAINREPIPSVTSRGLTVMHPAFAGLNEDSSLAELGRDWLGECVEELHDQDEVGVGESHRRWDQSVLLQRASLSVGSLECWIRVNKHRRVLIYQEEPSNWDDGIMGSLGAREGIAEYEGPGTVEFYVVPELNVSAFFVWREQQVVGHHAVSHLNQEEDVARLHLDPIKRRTMLEVLAGREQILESVIADSGIHLVRDQMNETMPPALAGFYTQIASMIDDGENWETTAGELAQGGLYQVFGRDGDFLRGLSILGNAMSVGYDREDLSKLFQNAGLGLDDVLASARRWANERNVKTVGETDDGLILSLL